MRPFLESNKFLVHPSSLPSMSRQDSQGDLIMLAGFSYPDLQQFVQTPFVVLGIDAFRPEDFRREIEETKRILVSCFDVYFQAISVSQGRGLVILGQASLWLPHSFN
jgi:hypothetical protein